MEHPISGFSASRNGRTKTTALIHGGTSLKLSEGGESPLLEAHPGSPVDLNKPRPSLASSLAAQRHFQPSDEDQLKSPRSPGKREDNITRDGVAAKALAFAEPRVESYKHEIRSPRNKSHGSQTFDIPTKAPEQEVVDSVPALRTGKLSTDTAVESAEMSLEFEDKGISISANPAAHGSRTSLVTTTTVASTLVDDKAGHIELTVDTNVASSTASMASEPSLNSAMASHSSDIYGWEEELDRKTSIEGYNLWERELNRRLPSGGRAMGPRLRNNTYDFQFKRAPSDGKRRSLLHRVLNLSSSRRTPDDIFMSGGTPSNDYHCPTTSA